jgi:Glutaminase
MGLNLLLALLLAPAAPALPGNGCVDSYSRLANAGEEPPVDESVLNDIKGSYYEILHKTDPEAIEKWNASERRALNALPTGARTKGRLPGLDPAQRQALMNRLLENPTTDVTNTAYDAVPNTPGHVWGYCFGRAMATHLFALQEGVDKTQIRKIWAVGALENADYAWHFHVATIVRGTDGKWYVFDPLTSKVPVVLEDWMDAMKGRGASWLKEVATNSAVYQKEMADPAYQWSRDMDSGSDLGKLQFFSSEAKRFWPYEDTTYNVRYPQNGPPTARDKATPMNIRDPKFHGYFEDLLKSIREEAQAIAAKARAAAAANR